MQRNNIKHLSSKKSHNICCKIFLFAETLLSLAIPPSSVVCADTQSSLPWQFCSDSVPITSNMSVNKNISWTLAWLVVITILDCACSLLQQIWIDCNMDPNTTLYHCWQYFCISVRIVCFQLWLWTMPM